MKHLLIKSSTKFSYHPLFLLFPPPPTLPLPLPLSSSTTPPSISFPLSFPLPLLPPLFLSFFSLPLIYSTNHAIIWRKYFPCKCSFGFEETVVVYARSGEYNRSCSLGNGEHETHYHDTRGHLYVTSHCVFHVQFDRNYIVYHMIRYSCIFNYLSICHPSRLFREAWASLTFSWGMTVMDIPPHLNSGHHISCHYVIWYCRFS